jgi:DNA mismatch repair ATPase MutS
MAELTDEHGKVLIESDGSESTQARTNRASSTSADIGFVPNDTLMDSSSSLHVVSGVNGSGKTT